MSEQIKSTTTKKASAVKVLTLKDVGIADKKIISKHTFSVAIHTLLQNWRQGTVACQGRSQVTGSTKKPWKQKGTGRARAGDVKSPIWRGGGVTFGPQKRTRTVKITKQQRKNVMIALIGQSLEKGIVKTIDWKLSSDLPKTKEAMSMLTQVGSTNVQTNLFLHAHDLVTVASFSNIPFVRIIFFDSANVYDLSDSSHWVVLKKDIESFKGMVAQWI